MMYPGSARVVRIATLAILATGLLACGSGSNPAATSPPPDLTLTAGKIYTLDDDQRVVEAIAMRDGLIVSVGDADSITKMAGPDTVTLNLAGETVLPGFHDRHVHPIFAGLMEIRCTIPQGSTMEQLLEQVRECAHQTPKDGWVTGGQWDVSALGETPNARLLDAVTEKPVFLYDTSGHSAWANSRAMEIAGIDRDTQDPEGGIIERDADGSPTGVLREGAVLLVGTHVPPISDETLDTALQWGLDTMLSHGITSFTEAAVGFNAGSRRDFDTYLRVSEAGRLKQRTRLCITWTPGNDDVETILETRAGYSTERLAVDCVKLFLDGVPTDSHTAAMLDPYAGMVEGRDDAASIRGMLLFRPEVLREAVARFDSMGLTVKFHAAGDAAVRAGLKAVAHARESNGDSGLIHNVGHCTFVAEEDIPFASSINATFELSPYLWSPSPINDDITRAIGPKRIERVWPVKDIVESDALIVVGSDWAVVPSASPWIAIEALVTRERPGGSDESFGKGQAISVRQAIELFTVNSAKHMGMEGSIGQIKTGALADVIVVDRDPFEVPSRELHQVTVTKTIIGGEVVFDRSGTGAPTT